LINVLSVELVTCVHSLGQMCNNFDGRVAFWKFWFLALHEDKSCVYIYLTEVCLFQDENRSLVERLIRYKSKDADKMNEENENFVRYELINFVLCIVCVI